MPTNRVLDGYQGYLREVTSINNEAIRRLIECDSTPPLELAAMFEDIANLYLDFSESIRQQYLADHRATVLPYPRANPAADRAG